MPKPKSNPNPTLKIHKNTALTLIFITKSLELCHSECLNPQNFSPAAGIHWVNESSNLQFCPQTSLCEFIEILPLILTVITKSLLRHSVG